MISLTPVRRAPAQKLIKAPFLAQPWVVVCVYLQCAGWLLSAIHQLNATGYAAALVVGGIALWKTKPDFGRVRLRRFRRLFPLCFLGLALLAILGGVLYGPSNYDGLTYRIPRVMHWLAEGRWHWIHTEFERLNTRATGWEWLAAPVIALSGSYRWLFVFNAVAFFLMPGLIFSVFTRLGVRPRVAWYWMWLGPTGYCFLLQAGSISNDMLGAVFALAAIDFALRARTSGQISDVWFSGLSAALMTASKSSNLPLLLPWLIAVAPALGLLTHKFFKSAAIVLCAAGASLLPISLQNYKHCGDWTGLAAESAQMRSSLLHLPANAVLFTIQNFVPPVFPIAKQWNALVRKIVPPNFTQRLEQIFEPGGAHFELSELAVEEGAGVGCGLSFLTFISLLAVPFLRRNQTAVHPMGSNPPSLVLISIWIGIAACMYKSGIGGTAARIIAPYYLLIIAACLIHRAQVTLVRTGWWRGLAAATFAMALFPMVLSPARPLWPAQAVLEKLDAMHSNNPLLRRAYNVYSVYGERSNGFAPALAALPSGVRVLGFITFDDPETSLWFPFGARRIEHVTNADDSANLRARGIEYLLVKPDRLSGGFDQWAAKMGVQQVKTIPLALRATQGSLDWCLVRLPPNR